MMYQVNLLPWRARRQRQRYLFWRQVMLAHLGVLLLILLGWWGYLFQQQQKAQLTWRQQSEWQLALEQQEQRFQQALQQRDYLQQQQQWRQRQQRLNQFYLQLLQRVPELLPPPLWLTRFELDSQQLRLSGKSHESSAVWQFSQRLSQLATLHTVELGLLERGTDGLFYFSLSAQSVPQVG